MLISATQEGELVDGYRRRSAITNAILAEFRATFEARITNEDIFYYVYGVLHSPEYRERFASDLKKMLPRIPFTKETVDFWKFSQAGRDLARGHLNYETVEPYPVQEYNSSLSLDPAIEWIMERYQVTRDKDSGIANDPNDWSREQNQPRYILDLLMRIITVSLETMKIVRSLPALNERAKA